MSLKERKKVQVWIYTQLNSKEIQVLLLLTQPSRGSFWQPITGSVEEGETLATAALREAREETGFEFDQPLLDLNYDFIFQAREKKFHEFCFSIAVSKPESPVLDSHEHSDFQWVTSDHAMKILKHASNQEALTALLGLLRKRNSTKKCTLKEKGR